MSLPCLYFECSWWLPKAQPCLPRGVIRTRNFIMKWNHCAHKSGFSSLIPLPGSWIACWCSAMIHAYIYQEIPVINNIRVYCDSMFITYSLYIIMYSIYLYMCNIIYIYMCVCVCVQDKPNACLRPCDCNLNLQPRALWNIFSRSRELHCNEHVG